MKSMVFSDGSSRGNPGRGGYGAIICIDDRIIELGGREDETTNNRMELTAVLEAVRVLKDFGIRETLVYTDSSYVANAVSKWLTGWVKNDWQTKSGDPVLNRDILECFYDLEDFIKIHFKVIPGHSGIPANERCDEIATSFADGNGVPLFKGLQKDYLVPLTLSSHGIKKGKSSSAKKPYSYVSEVQGKVEVHTTWASCEQRVKGKKARFKKVFSKEEESKLIKEFQL